MPDDIDDLKNLLGIEPESDAPEPDEPKGKPPAAPAEPEADDPISRSVREAHFVRQKNWERDAKDIFRGPDEAEMRRRKLIDDVAALDAQHRREIEKAAEARRKAEEAAQRKSAAEALRETAAAAAADLRDRIAASEAQIRAARTEIARLEKIVKG